ncbi:MAG TPA: iron-containing alcohol dehydrogenase [Thermomicrobiales bacterium]|nr:iron-containing alcohol dehydrogenase [Thermomicrobiales bacterium]
MGDSIRASGFFRLPTEIRFGEGVAAELGEWIVQTGGRRVLVVTDPGVRRADIVDRLLDTVPERIEREIWDGVHPNPRDSDCLAGADAARAFNADLIIAIGGGSPIDAAKAVAALATNGGVPADWATPRTLERDPLPLLAVPTTAGTGSEVTRSSVITDTGRQFKLTVKDPRMAPRVALVDPALTYSLPPNVTAATGMDVLTHAVEAYTCRRANAFSDALALHAIRLVSRYLAAAVRDGDDHDARHGMMMASTIAGMAFSNADVAAVHCLAEALGGRYDVPHGIANAVFLPPIFAFNLEADPERHADVAAALGLDTRRRDPADAARTGATLIAGLAREVGIPRFTDLPRIDPGDFAAIAKASAANGSNPSNARRMDAAAYQQILEEAWKA